MGDINHSDEGQQVIDEHFFGEQSDKLAESDKAVPNVSSVIGNTIGNAIAGGGGGPL